MLVFNARAWLPGCVNTTLKFGRLIFTFLYSPQNMCGKLARWWPDLGPLPTPNSRFVSSFSKGRTVSSPTPSLSFALLLPPVPLSYAASYSLRTTYCILLAANDILLLESIPRSIRSSSLHSTRLDCARRRALARSPLPSGPVSSGTGREPPHQLQVLPGCTSTFRVPLGVYCAGALRPPISSCFRCCGPA